MLLRDLAGQPIAQPDRRHVWRAVPRGHSHAHIHRSLDGPQTRVWLWAGEVGKGQATDNAVQESPQAGALRVVQYCDGKRELEEACAVFDVGYETESKLYTDITVPRIREDINARVEIYEAGETLIHQVRFPMNSLSRHINGKLYPVGFEDFA